MYNDAGNLKRSDSSTSLSIDRRHSFVSDFFKNWFDFRRNASRDGGKALYDLYHNLIAPATKHGISMSDEELTNLFPNGVSSNDVSLYLISRLVLHAIIVSPIAWTEVFADYLSNAIPLIKEKDWFGDVEQCNLLLKQLEACLILYKNQSNLDAISMEEMPIIIPQNLQGINHKKMMAVSFVLSQASELDQTQFLRLMGRDSVSFDIDTPQKLTDISQILSLTNFEKLLHQLDKHKLAKLRATAFRLMFCYYPHPHREQKLISDDGTSFYEDREEMEFIWDASTCQAYYDRWVTFP